MQAQRVLIGLTGSHQPPSPLPTGSGALFQLSSSQGCQSLPQWYHRSASQSPALPQPCPAWPWAPLSWAWPTGWCPSLASTQPYCHVPAWPPQGWVWCWVPSPGLIMTPTCRLISWLGLCKFLWKWLIPWAGDCPHQPALLPCLALVGQAGKAPSTASPGIQHNPWLPSAGSHWPMLSMPWQSEVVWGTTD